MLSEATLAYLSPQPDVNDSEIDALVHYAATSRPDAWQAIKLMHECHADGMIAQYLIRLQDINLIALGNILPYIWKRIEALQQLQQRRQAEADAQPKPMQQQKNMQEMMDSVSTWMRKQDVEVRTTTVCQAIQATVQANLVRCKQDWAALLRLIRDEGEWLTNLTNKSFIEMVEDNCHIDAGNLPTLPTLKVLSFGKSRFPAWSVIDYDPPKLNSLTQMASYMLTHIYDQVQQAQNHDHEKPFAV